MRHYATILCLLLTVPAYAVDTLTVAPQPEPLSEAWRWTEFNLPGRVRDVFEDREGNMWFATNVGAVRYDGTHYRTFTTEDGLGANRIRTITQTPDGALWFGTLGGRITRMLADSVHTYTVNDGLASGLIWFRSLTPSGDTGLWAGFRAWGELAGGLSRFDGRKWSVVETPADTLRVVSLTEAKDGSLWIASNGQGLLRYRGGEWTVFGPEQGLPGLNYVQVIQASDGSVWATTLDGPAIVQHKDDGWTVYGPEDGLTDAAHRSIWETPDRQIWSASIDGDIVTFAGDGWHVVDVARKSGRGHRHAAVSRSGSVWLFPLGRPLAHRIRIGEHLRSRFRLDRSSKGGHRTPDGSTWFVTDNGPVRSDGRNWMLYGPKEGLLDPPYVTMTATDDGSLWFLADQSRGWCRYVAGRWETHTSSDIGLHRLSIAPATSGKGKIGVVYRRADSTFWVAGSRDGRAAVSRYDGQSWQVLNPGVDAERLHSPFVAANGDIWFGTNVWPTLGVLVSDGVMHFDGSTWTRYTTNDGLLHNRIYGFGQSPDGTIWAGTMSGISWFTGTAWSSYEEGFPGNKARGFRVSGSDMWCTYGGVIGVAGGLGVSRYRSDIGPGQSAWRTYRMRDGLAGEVSEHVLPDSDGTVWVATDNGISHFDPRTELWTVYTEEDGIWPGIVEHLWLEEDGRLGYTTRAGLTGILTMDKDAPETRFEVAPTEVGSSGNIQLTWSGLDLWDVTPPERVRYQYRLDDGDWSSWTTRDGATLTSLSPGKHRIELRAADHELNVDPTPVVHTFVVEAPWWRNPVVAGPGLLLLITVLFQSARVVQAKRKLQDSVDALSSANNELFQVNVDLQREQVLERLRGQAQGMQSSEDIAPVVEAVHRELSGLGLPLMSTALAISSETGVEHWTTGEDGRAREPYITQVGSSGPDGEARREARRRGDAYFHIHREGEEAKDALRGSIERGNPRWAGVPEEQWPQESDTYGVFFDGGGVFFLSETPIDEEYLMLIKRFGEVFGYAHSRYTELQEKEAQNRELTVEASLERVRARALGMQESTDLGDVAKVLFDEMVNLGFEATRSAVTTIDRTTDTWTNWWGEVGRGVVLGSWTGQLSILEGEPWVVAWGQGEAPYHLTKRSREEVEEREGSYGILPESENERKAYLDLFENGQFHYFFFFKQGWLSPVLTRELSDEDIHVAERFAQVFALAYDRFEELQEKEEQNQELKNQNVLERLRGQAQGMQSSEDIGPVIEAIYRELDSLDIQPYAVGVTVYRPDGLEHWRLNEDGSAADPYYTVQTPEQLAQRERDRSPGSGSDCLEGDEARDLLTRLGERGNPRWKGVPREELPSLIERFRVRFETGWFLIVTPEPLPAAYRDLVGRFVQIFEFAHARWEELKEKEAQNRRLAVEAAVQRLRAEVQTMDEASDFERILSLLTESLKTVELTFDGCEIDVLDEPVENPTMAHFEANGFRYTTYTLDPDGRVGSESFPVPAPFPGIVRETIERFIESEPWFGTSQGKAIVEVPAGSYGRLRLTTTDRDSFTDDEVATLREFADAVALGYARYLDIREIQEATERKSAFLASMSHELRTPMNAIKGFTNLVLRRGKDQAWERNEENLTKVSQASDHLLTMIDDLLDLSKIEAGQMDVNPERFDVRELVTSACDTVSPLIQEGVELKQEVADDIGEANTDKARLQQMVINLLSNAIKFTDSGSVTVSAASEDGQLVVAVTDTGKGIPVDELPTIFDEYRQAEGSESSVQKGTGLGLSITKKFAELLGGTIGVESEVGKGSTFTVRVPVEYQQSK